MKVAKVYGFEGEGTTVAEAKKDAIAKIESQSEGYWTPRVFIYRGMTAFIYRDLTGWNYVIQWEDKAPNYNLPCVHSGYNGPEDATFAACRHMGQIGWKHEDGFDSIPDIMKDNPEAEKSEHKRWAFWQTNYAKKRAEGATDEQAREYAADQRF